MHVSVSRAEEQILQELIHRGLNRFLETQKGFSFIWQVEGVFGTIVDFYYNAPYRYAIFLDGPHHLRYRQASKDELIQKALENRHIMVDRFSYHVPLRKKRKREICDCIEEQLMNKHYIKRPNE